MDVNACGMCVFRVWFFLSFSNFILSPLNVFCGVDIKY